MTSNKNTVFKNKNEKKNLTQTIIESKTNR